MQNNNQARREEFSLTAQSFETRYLSNAGILYGYKLMVEGFAFRVSRSQVTTQLKKAVSVSGSAYIRPGKKCWVYIHQINTKL